MKFFTPDLLAAFADGDPRIANDAQQRWESAIVSYRKHLKKIGKQFPGGLKKFADTVSLHDSQYFGISKIAGPFAEGGLAQIVLKRQEKFVLIFYLLVKEPMLVAVDASHVLGSGEVFWLYDEIDVDSSGFFLHEILLSNEKVLMLRFMFFDMFEIDVADPRFNGIEENALPTLSIR